jgi:hypothetical protein
VGYVYIHTYICMHVQIHTYIRHELFRSAGVLCDCVIEDALESRFVCAHMFTYIMYYVCVGVTMWYEMYQNQGFYGSMCAVGCLCDK